MKNVLIPTDFSENSWNSIEYALSFFKDITCSFYLLHVDGINTFIGGEAPSIPSEQVIEKVYLKKSKEKLLKIIKKISKLPKNSNHRFFTISDYNFFIDSIRKHVEEKEIDFIVMGTKGASGIKKLIIGSNTADIITKVHCTTFVIPENAKYVDPMEIAFPSDYSLFYPIKTLEPLTEIINRFNATLRILHVGKKAERLNQEEIINKEYLEDFFNDVKHSFSFLTNNHIEDAIQCFVQSREINMIVMVAKNLNYFQKLLFKPSVEEISYHTEVPFLVLHE